MTLRDEATPDDVQTVREIVSSTGFFSAAEIDVAVELVRERLAHGPASGYFFLFGEVEGRPVGYTCYGPIACTVGSFDLYWIVVHSDFQGRGLGRRLLAATEQRMAAAGARRIYVDTSGRTAYEPTRRFYEACGYVGAAVLADFYSPGDDKVVYVKVLRGPRGTAL